jgi:hypothetical protein
VAGSICSPDPGEIEVFVSERRVDEVEVRLTVDHFPGSQIDGVYLAHRVVVLARVLLEEVRQEHHAVPRVHHGLVDSVPHLVHVEVGRAEPTANTTTSPRTSTAVTHTIANCGKRSS